MPQWRDLDPAPATPRGAPPAPKESALETLRAQLQAYLDGVEKENQEMRLALCMAHAGAGAYLDDGEMQDNTRHPMIDWKRDPWETIKAKLAERGRAALAKACPDAVRMAPTYQPLFTKELMDAGPEAIERARQEGLQKLQAEIDAGAVRIEDLSPESADTVITENRRRLGVRFGTDEDPTRFGL